MLVNLIVEVRDHQDDCMMERALNQAGYAFVDITDLGLLPGVDNERDTIEEAEATLNGK